MKILECDTNKAPPIICSRRKFQICCFFINNKIRHDISWEWTAGRQFSWNIIPYFLKLGKMSQNLLSAAVVIGTLRIMFFVWFDSLRPINTLSVIKGRVFLGWTSTKLELMFLLKDTTQWRRWGSNPRPLGLESSTLPLSHCAPIKDYVKCLITGNFAGIDD